MRAIAIIDVVRITTCGFVRKDKSRSFVVLIFALKCYGVNSSVRMNCSKTIMARERSKCGSDDQGMLHLLSMLPIFFMCRSYN